MEKGTPFYLSKWYLDVVGKEGEVWIGYYGTLRWKAVVLKYHSYLLRSRTGKFSSRSRLGATPSPCLKGTTLTWSPKRLKLDGKWEAMSPPILKTLFELPEGKVEWRCHVPRAKVALHISKRAELIGKGYAEQLVFTLEPWKLPMEELRWGRFISALHSLIWIEFRNSDNPSHQWVFLDGETVHAGWIGEGAIVIPGSDMVLSLENRQVIRESHPITTLARRLFFAIPAFRKWIPRNFLHAKEQKWLSRGVLLQNGNPVDTGWVVHERVRFRPSKREEKDFSD